MVIRERDLESNNTANAKLMEIQGLGRIVLHVPRSFKAQQYCESMYS